MSAREHSTYRAARRAAARAEAVHWTGSWASRQEVRLDLEKTHDPATARSMQRSGERAMRGRWSGGPSPSAAPRV